MYAIDTDSPYMALTPVAIKQALDMVLMLRVAAQYEESYTLDVADKLDLIDAMDSTSTGNTLALRKAASDLHELDVSLRQTAFRMKDVMFSWEIYQTN